MAQLLYQVSPAVFDMFPLYTCGVVAFTEVSNFDAVGAANALLRAEEAACRSRLAGQDMATHPYIAPWRDAFRAFGAKPSEFRSAVEAIVRRVMRGESLPAINPLVDIGNATCLKHLVPIGVHALDSLQYGIALRLADGSEAFSPLGASTCENPLPGEVILADGETVLTRRWTWRQGERSMVQRDTTAAIFNVDGLPPISPALVETICEEIRISVRCFCGGHGTYSLLSKNNPVITLDLP